MSYIGGMGTERIATTTLEPAALAGAAAVAAIEAAARLRFRVSLAACALTAGACALLAHPPAAGLSVAAVVFVAGGALCLVAPRRGVALGPVLCAVGYGGAVAFVAAPATVAVAAFLTALILGEGAAALVPGRARLAAVMHGPVAAVLAVAYLPLGLPFAPVAAFSGAALAALALAHARLAEGAVAYRHGPDQPWLGAGTYWVEGIRLGLLALLRVEGEELSKSTKEPS